MTLPCQGWFTAPAGHSSIQAHQCGSQAKAATVAAGWLLPRLLVCPPTMMRAGLWLVT